MGSPATCCAIFAASNDWIMLLPVTSATTNWFPVKRLVPATCCATLPASNEFMAPFAPPGLVGVTVYEPAPNPVNVYVPGNPVVSDTVGAPAPVTSTFWTKRGAAGDPRALPYVITPCIEGVNAGVGVFVGVLVLVADGVGVLVLVSDGVGVLVLVAVAVGVAVFVAVGVMPVWISTEPLSQPAPNGRPRPR